MTTPDAVLSHTHTTHDGQHRRVARESSRGDFTEFARREQPVTNGSKGLEPVTTASRSFLAEHYCDVGKPIGMIDVGGDVPDVGRISVASFDCPEQMTGSRERFPVSPARLDCMSRMALLAILGRFAIVQPADIPLCQMLIGKRAQDKPRGANDRRHSLCLSDPLRNDTLVPVYNPVQPKLERHRRSKIEELLGLGD